MQLNMTRRQTEHRRLFYHKQQYETDYISEAKPQDIAKFFAQKRGLKLWILAKFIKAWDNIVGFKYKTTF